MPKQEKRRSSRVIPVVSEEEVLLIQAGDNAKILAKLLDFSEFGTLAYLLTTDIDVEVGAACLLTLYHQGKVFTVPAKIIRKTGRLIGFDFGDLSGDSRHAIASKLLRTEVEWLRLSRGVGV